MNCARLQQVLDAHIDGELDHTTAGEVAAHLSGCAACAVLHDQRMALQTGVRAHAAYFTAPATLAPALRRALTQAAVAATPARPMPAGFQRGLSWFHAAAFATVTALAGLVGGYWLALSGARPDYPLRDPVVASHVASLSPKRQLTEITSGDRHTVKPWFQGRIDIAPTVKDLSDDGFVLLGGRLDQVADKPAAAVVYQIRKHVINLFVWRAADATPEDIASATVRGFSVTTWASGGLRFAAVSDVDGRDLTRFAQRLSAP